MLEMDQSGDAGRCLPKSVRIHHLILTALVCTLYLWMNYPRSYAAVTQTELIGSNLHSIRNMTQQQFLKRLTIMCGTQKGGTSSLLKTLEKTDGIMISTQELHFFDRKFLRHQDDIGSFDKAIHYYYEYTENTTEYIDALKKAFPEHTSSEPITWGDLPTDVVLEKTPEYVVYPHIAYILASDFVKYGTKLIVLLRDPTKRIISSYFQEHKKHGYEYNSNHFEYLWNGGLDGYLDNVVLNETNNGNHSFIRFSNDLSTFQTIEDMDQMVLYYQEFLYFYLSKYNQMQLESKHHALSIYYFIWIRGCYAPQVMTMLYHIRKYAESLQMNPSMKYRNSFKLIQSERYYDEKTFHLTMTKLLCYMRYDADHEYEKWMNECVEEDRFGGGQIEEMKSNSQTKGFVPSEELLTRIASSYNVCNQKLKVILDDMYPNIVLDAFDWTSWQME